MNPSPQPSREETVRADFEKEAKTSCLKWGSEKIAFSRKANGAYVIAWLQRRWEVWQAAYSAGEAARKEKDARFIEAQREGGNMTDAVQVFDVLAAAIRKEF